MGKVNFPANKVSFVVDRPKCFKKYFAIYRLFANDSYNKWKLVHREHLLNESKRKYAILVSNNERVGLTNLSTKPPVGAAHELSHVFLAIFDSPSLPRHRPSHLADPPTSVTSRFLVFFIVKSNVKNSPGMAR